MTLVMACRMITPAFSISFLDKPDVTHTFNAGWGVQLPSLGPMLWVMGMLFNFVIKTPFARVWR